MKNMLIQLLSEYLESFKANQKECLEMIRNGEPKEKWQEHAKKGAGLKLMIESTILELKKYN